MSRPYVVTDRLNYGGRVYGPGDTVMLTDNEARPYVRAGLVVHEDDAT